jgi:hypothetical protein
VCRNPGVITVYGGDGGISSLNHVNQTVTWWQEDRDQPGFVINPYELLASLINKSMRSNDNALMSPGDLDKKADAEISGINNGGAALMIYLMIQSKTIPDAQLDVYKTSMKYYCELDTLAMAMIMESWINDYKRWGDTKNPFQAEELGEKGRLPRHCATGGHRVPAPRYDILRRSGPSFAWACPWLLLPWITSSLITH